MGLRILLFLIINFAGIGLGGLFTGSGISSNWYNSLEIAPWTPPGWVFGFAWTSIMICFAVFMAFAYSKSKNKSLLIGLYILQWLLNLSWSIAFFNYQAVVLGLIIIISLTLLVAYFLFSGYASLKYKTLLMAPYFIWLVIATSLNFYIYLNN